MVTKIYQIRSLLIGNNYINPSLSLDYTHTGTVKLWWPFHHT